MIDITAQLRAAAAAWSRWPSSSAVTAARAIGHELRGETDWDEGAGEGWLRVVRGEQVLALVCAACPLVVVLDALADELPPLDDVVVVRVPAMDDAVLSCDPDSLERAFGVSTLSPALDPDRFSADDLWYATV